MKTIGFIGLGVMGGCMANRLIDAGYRLRVYEVVPEKTEPFVARGAAFCPTVADVAQGADAVITMLGYPSDVEQVYFGENGLLSAAKAGTLLIDMTTSSPELAQRIAFAGVEKGFAILDAPVSGGPSGAAEGTLSIMVGGEKAAFEAAEPLFAILGKTVTLTGGPGMGQNTKMANQIAVACNITAVAEAFAYAKATGLDPAIMFHCVSQGAGGSWQMSNMSGRMVAGDDAAGFFIRHLIKDMDIALSEADAHGIDLPLLQNVRAIYGKLADEGMQNCGTQAVYHFYDQK